MKSVYRGPLATLKKARSGIMLSPVDTQDTDMFGISLPRSAYGQPLPPGAGYIIRGGQPERTQVIIPDE
jgi:S-DNA-T family DNA segregation ATPase FtsK/SpoIIIE